MESQSPARGSDSTFDLQWDSSYDLGNHFADGSHDDRFRFSLHYIGFARDDPTIGALIADPWFVFGGVLFGVAAATYTRESRAQDNRRT